MCDQNKIYTAYGEINMPNGSKNVIQLKYIDGTAVNNTPSRLRMILSGSNPNMKKVQPINYNGITYVPNPKILYNNNNCIAGSMFSGSKMIFPYIDANSVGMYAGKKKTRSSRKKTRKSRGTPRRTTRRRRTRVAEDWELKLKCKTGIAENWGLNCKVN
jgi:hypothetical protein